MLSPSSAKILTAIMFVFCSFFFPDESLLKKYPALSDMEIFYIEAIKEGFVNPSAHPPRPLGNTSGREALYNVFSVCRDLLRRIFPDECLANTLRVTNVGGRAPDFGGSCVVATYEDNKDRSEEAALEFLSKCKLPDSKKRGRKGPRSVKEYIPHTQLSSQHVPAKDYFMTAEVKAGSIGQKRSDEEMLEAWMQALVGLKRLGTSYGVLLRPDEGVILELHVQSREGKRHERMATKVKTWSFCGDSRTENKFQTEQFLDFMSAIISIMLKHK